jgi:hypothetical protein
MNIFKTLASGSGSINEPNVSAFLGYLLNPKEDHGLGDTFLRKFLKPLLDLDKDNLKFLKDRNLSIRSNFEMVVLLEQAFKKDIGKKVVDIVIICYENESQQGQSLAENIIKQKIKGDGIPKHIFLIENKIVDDSVRKGEEQLQNQYQQTIEKLDEIINKDRLDKLKIEDLVSVLFVTPGGNNSIEEFDNFKGTSDKHLHLFWNKRDSISKMIKEILEKETLPIDVYCKHTLQAFWEFIENGFKSKITEEFEATAKDYTKYDFDGATNLPKNRLVEAVIAKYIQDHQDCTLDVLQKVFQKKLQGSKNCVIDANEAKTPINIGYYFIKDEELITLENGDKIAISSWWDKDNVLKFIAKAESLGYKISKSTQI